LNTIEFDFPIVHFDAGSVEISLDQRISAFVGVNNVGKSQLVKNLVSLLNSQNRQSENFKVTFNGKLKPATLNDFFQNYGQHSMLELGFVTSLDTSSPKNVEVGLGYSQDYGNRKIFVQGNPVPNIPVHNFTNEHLNVTDFETTVFIGAERDIRPTNGWQPGQVFYSENGDSIVPMFDRLLNMRSGNHRIVEERILTGLNRILSPHFRYISIRCLRDDSGRYNIQLENEQKEIFDVSQLGSGIKTIIHCLSTVHAYSTVWGAVPTCIVVEEIENNLHPAIIRRTLDQIVSDTAGSATRLVFITHSPVVIEHLSSHHSASIHLVNKTSDQVKCTPIRNYLATSKALDELGVRATDLLQSNFVVWVEGPTELIVIPHWISKLAPELRVGSDYIVASYGGKLLKHFSAEPPSEDGDTRVDVARINRNFAFVMDNDRSVDGKPLTPSKQAIVDARNWIDEQGKRRIEFELWITEGREIEDYYPNEPFIEILGAPLNAGQLTKRENSWGCKKTISQGWGANVTVDKVELARALVALNKEPSADVTAGLAPIIEAIRKANA
jgi:putative ATP-dependent endonuclease of the OLD family